ncbi:MAG: DUF1059 domain-containing protein [bacterium]|nr:DUF1059 domain-containing protein [bacterium]
MKTMTCNQLGGACDKEFQAETFAQIAEMSKKHGREMLEKEDPEHISAMNKMKELMQKPEDMQIWFDSKKQEFESLPED